MKRKIIVSCLWCCSLFAMGQTDTVHVKIIPQEELQTIEGFGASDCWTVHYVGKYWNNHEKEKAAKWLFSTQNDDSGNPEGIGLSIWRVNIGAGTIEQGEKSRIKDITRRAECFINQQGEYDWSKQIGQQWFVDKAKDMGCPSFVLFTNSPPIHYTRNGLGFATKGDESSNLCADRYDDFSHFLCNVADYFIKKKKVPVEYISPVNEPQWKWDSDYQEGSPWHNHEIHELVTCLDKQIKKHKLPVKILITEAGTWEAIYRPEGRAFNQMTDFFSPTSPYYLGNFKTIDHTIGAHSYWTDTRNDKLTEIRTNAKKSADKYNVRLLQTEWSLLNRLPIDNFPATYEAATYNDIALHMAKIIYADLVYANVSSWSFWTSMDVEMYGFKNRFNLIRLHTENDQTATIEKGGYVSDTKTLWMLGNYSRFIRPGYKRISLQGANDLSSLMGTAYFSPQKKQLVLVFTNISNNNIPVEISCSDHSLKKFDIVSSYITNEENNLKYQDITNEFNANKHLSIPARSTITFVFD